MIRQEIYIREYDWIVHALYAVTDYYVEEIMDYLWTLGCDAHKAKQAYENMTSGQLNNGLCYSNYVKKESVLVIAKTTSAEEFTNSMFHELTHLQSHIAQVFYLKPTSEDVAYLTGGIIMQMYPKVKHLICNCCRKNNKHSKQYDYEEENR